MAKTRTGSAYERRKVGDHVTMEIIRSLIERIDVYPAKERGRYDVVLAGALAQILAFTQQKTTADPSSGDDGTFLMVAGAGFEPATFRL